MYRRSFGIHTGGMYQVSSPLQTKIRIPTVQTKMKRLNGFLVFIKSLKTDTFEINSLRINGIVKTDAQEKANICNRRSDFMRETDSYFTPKGESPFDMDGIAFYPSGVTKLLQKLNINRASGQEVAGSTPAEVGNILSWRLIMKYFLRSFSPFR